jgi:P63C domain
LRDYWQGQDIINRFLLPGYEPWHAEYSWEFANGVLRLYVLPPVSRGTAYPLAVGGFIARYIRSMLPPEVRRELRVRNPRNVAGNRPRRDHQHLTPDVKKEIERKRRDQVWTLMNPSHTIQDFEERLQLHDERTRTVARSAQRYGVIASLQGELDFPTVEGEV